MNEPLFDRPLPADVESENLILGQLIYAGLPFVDVSAALKAAHFSIERNRRVFRALEDMSQAETPISVATVAIRLKEAGQLESIGGVSGILELNYDMPLLSNPVPYFQKIISAYIRRQSMFLAQAVMDRAIRTDMSTDEIVSHAASGFEALFREGISKSDWLTVGDVIDRNEGGLQSILEWRKHGKGIQTPFAGLNRLTGGLQRKELTILGARPSAGKSAMAYQIAAFVADQPKHQDSEEKNIVAISSLEMSEESIICRFIPQKARVDATAMSWGSLRPADRQRALQAANSLCASGIRFEGSGSSTIREIKSRVSRLHAQTPVDLLIIDHLHLMDGDDENRNQTLGKITRELKLIAKSMNIAVLLLAQLSRAVEKRDPPRPQLSDLRDAGGIEQDADTAMFLFRPEVYDRNREDLRGVAELIVAKQRNGPIDTLNMAWLAEYQRFDEVWREGEI